MKLRPAEPWKLLIDKIAFAGYESNSADVTETCERIIAAYESGHFPDAVLKKSRRHRIQLAIPIQVNRSKPARLLIQAGPRFPGLCAYRLEFNPAILGSAGVDQLIGILDSTFVGGGHHLIRNSTMTRIDIALDLIGLSANQVIVRSSRKRTHGVFSNADGCPETIYLGTPKSNQTTAYNKIIDDRISLRVERRLHPRSAANQSALLPNPFRVVQLVHTDSLLPFLAGMIPDQFFDSVRIRGLTHVLATLPPAQRRAIKAVLKDPAQSRLPSTADVWRSWPSLLSTSGFGFLLDEH